MARKQSRRITSSRGSGKGSSGARKRSRSQSIVQRLSAVRQKCPCTLPKEQLRRPAFELLQISTRTVTHGKNPKDFQVLIATSAEALLPSAFFRDEDAQLQVRGFDRYTRTLKISTTLARAIPWLRARGNRQASLIGTWNNAMKAAGRGDFSLDRCIPSQCLHRRRAPPNLSSRGFKDCRCCCR